MYVLQKNKSVCVFHSLSYVLFFTGDKISAGCFKYEITPSLKSNGRLKLSQDVALHHLIDKEKPKFKLL